MGTSRVGFSKLVIHESADCGDHIDANDLKWVSKVMERAAQYHNALAEMAGKMGHDAKVALSGLACEFFTIRTALAWQQNNAQMAEYYLSRATENELSQLRAAEHTARVLHDIGSRLLAQKSYPLAVKWLQLAFDVLSKIDPPWLSENGPELRFSVTHKLGRLSAKLLFLFYIHVLIGTSEGTDPVGHAGIPSGSGTSH